MESQPFNNDTIPDTSGLFVILSQITQRIVSYKCVLCNKEYGVVNNSMASSRRNFIKHAKSESHLCRLILSSSINQTLPTQPLDSVTNPLTSSLSTINDDLLLTECNTNSLDECISPPINEDSSSICLLNTVANCNHEHVRRTLAELFGQHSSNYLYFLHESLVKNSGCKAIVASCLSEKALYSFVSDFDVELHFNILKVVLSLSQKQRRNLAEVFSSFVFNFFEKESTQLMTKDNLVTNLQMPIPVTYQDFRRNYTHGPKSLLCNLPYPNVYQFLSNNKCVYAYTKVKECIAYFLACGGRILSPDQICPEAVCKAQILKLNDEQIPIFIKIWSDGFEINNVKQNRGHGAWSCTFTIFGNSPHIHVGQEDINATFTLGICNSTDYKSQDLILKGVIEDVNFLYENDVSYFSSHDNKVITGRVIILLTTQDQPERRKRNYLLLGNSKPSNRWGYIIPDIDEINKKMPSCSSCVHNMINDTWNYKTSLCPDCFNWDSCLSQKKRKLSHKYLNDTLYEIHTQLSQDNMSLAQLKAICISQGLNEKAALLIYDQFHKNDMKLRIQQDNNFSNSNFHNTILSKRMNGPSYELWTGSPLWKSLSHDIHDNIDVPMHLLFLGIVKSTMAYINEFFKVTSLDRSFTRVMSHKMKCILATYKLDWLKLLPFKNDGSILDTTGWVGENYLSFSRIFLWYISPLSHKEYQDRQTLVTDVVDEDIHKWTKNQLKRYAEKNSITVGKANEKGKQPTKLEYRCAILEYKKITATMDTDVKSTVDSFLCDVNDVVLLVTYLHNLIHTLMRKTPLSIAVIRNNIEKYARLFINQLFKLTSYLSIKDVHFRLWNCQSLLNLGDMFERFGHLDMYWEGGLSGEAIIKYFKREKSCIVLENWPYHMLRSYYRRRALGICAPTSTYDQVHKKKMYHIYSSLEHIMATKNKLLPISFIRNICSKECFAIFLNGDEQLTRIDLILHERNIDVHGTWYQIHSIISTNVLIQDKLSDDYVPAILLPSTRLDESLYCIIDVHWN